MFLLGYGVIGNTAVFGTVVLGSSPGSPAFSKHKTSPILDSTFVPLSMLRGFLIVGDGCRMIE